MEFGEVDGTRGSERQSLILSMRVSRWCWTLNNPTKEDDEYLGKFRDCPMVRYVIFQRESGVSGTVHLQGYLQLKRAQRLSYVCKLLAPEKPHWEKQRAPENSTARDYCRKEDSRLHLPVEWGDFVDSAGERTDIARACDTVRTRGIKRCAREHPEAFVKYASGFLKYALYVTEPRDSPPICHVIWGTTGTGKTRSVLEDSPNVYSGANAVSGSTRWFDGYDGTTPLLLDEFDWTKWPIQFMLRMMDRYPMTVPCKGSSVTITNGCSKIYIVSNIPPSEWYRDVHVDILAAFARRVAIWLRFDICDSAQCAASSFTPRFVQLSAADAMPALQNESWH